MPYSRPNQTVIRIDGTDDVLPDAGMLVVGQFWPKVDVPRRLGHVDDQLKADEAFLLDSGPSARTEFEVTRLAEARCSGDHLVVHDLQPRGLLGAVVEPHDHRDHSDNAGKADRPGI